MTKVMVNGIEVTEIPDLKDGDRLTLDTQGPVTLAPDRASMTLVLGPDWQGAYFQGRLLTEGGTIDWPKVFSRIGFSVKVMRTAHVPIGGLPNAESELKVIA